MTDVGKGRADHLELGDWNAQCYQCGRKRKASSMMKHWQGYWVCPEHWEARHPQDFVRAVPDVVTPPWTQPWPEDSYALGVVVLGPDDSGTYTLPASASGDIIINILEGCSITALDLSAGTAAVTSLVINVGGSLSGVTLASVGGAADPEINVQDGGMYDPSTSYILLRSAANTLLSLGWDGTLLATDSIAGAPFAGYTLCGGAANVALFVNVGGGDTCYLADADASFAILAGPTAYAIPSGSVNYTVRRSSSYAETLFIAGLVYSSAPNGFLVSARFTDTLANSATVSGPADTGLLNLGDAGFASNATTLFACIKAASGVYSSPGFLTVNPLTGTYTYTAFSSGLPNARLAVSTVFEQATICATPTQVCRLAYSVSYTTLVVEVYSLAGALLATVPFYTAGGGADALPAALVCDDTTLFALAYSSDLTEVKALSVDLETYVGTDVTANLPAALTATALDSYTAQNRSVAVNRGY